MKKYYLFQKNKVVIRADDASPLAVSQQELDKLCGDTSLYILPESPVDKNCFAIELPEQLELPQDYHAVTLRSLVGQMDDQLFNIWGKASELLHWHKTNRYCGSCGAQTEQHPRDLARYCPNCRSTFYPAISPCIIVLIHRKNDILLARSPRFPGKMFSTLAGFIEPGESAEQALHREVLEEVGIHVKNLRYFKSQPWPFPGQLMFGFFAEFQEGEILIDDDEICEAKWFPASTLPTIPGPATIAGQLIRRYVHSIEAGKQLDCRIIEL